jgi:hypothetical protein
MLVLGIVLTWAAPARAARAWEQERARVQSMLASADARRVSSVLAEVSLRASTPEAFAAEVVRTLADQPDGGRVSPATDALLRALFGRILQAMALGRTAPAVVAAPALSSGPVPQVAVEAPAVGNTAAAAPSQAYVAVEGAVTPSQLRPAIQSQGP